MCPLFFLFLTVIKIMCRGEGKNVTRNLILVSLKVYDFFSYLNNSQCHFLPHFILSKS